MLGKRLSNQESSGSELIKLLGFGRLTLFDVGRKHFDELRLAKF
jgi:hypothetical protein